MKEKPSRSTLGRRGAARSGRHLGRPVDVKKEPSLALTNALGGRLLHNLRWGGYNTSPCSAVMATESEVRVLAEAPGSPKRRPRGAGAISVKICVVESLGSVALVGGKGKTRGGRRRGGVGDHA